MTFSTACLAHPDSSLLDVAVAIVGGGPAGLMAAEVLSQAGVSVHLFDAMPSVGRKFLLAGKGGLNLTHSEAPQAFVSRYGARQTEVGQWLEHMDAQGVRDWAQGLGVETFVGSSGRVFPQEMKAAPLLRAWLHRLRHPASGVPVQFHMRHRWQGWEGEHLVFERTGAEGGVCLVRAKATVLAMGGASWPRLGSDGGWLHTLVQQGVAVAPLRAANCGFDVLGRDGQGWTEYFRTRYAGHPLKSVVLRVADTGGQAGAPRFERQGEFVFTETGVEGSLIYAASALLRDDLALGRAQLLLDLLPGKSAEQAISTAGGVVMEDLTPDLMLLARPGVYCAGEMLDWEAPTGGYLLTACLASGWLAGQGFSVRDYPQNFVAQMAQQTRLAFESNRIGAHANANALVSELLRAAPPALKQVLPAKSKSMPFQALGRRMA
eukprot:gene4638-4540_t